MGSPLQELARYNVCVENCETTAMQKGKEFKDLKEISEPDSSSARMAVRDSADPNGFRRMTLADLYQSADSLALPSSVPETVRAYFDAARMLWIYGWYYYPFFTWAGLHAGACAEMGLAFRFSMDSQRLPRRKDGFKDMLDEAVRRGWLKAEAFTRLRSGQLAIRGIGLPSGPELQTADPKNLEELEKLVLDQLKRFRDLRNWHAHPKEFSFGPPVDGYVALEFTRDLLVQLFSAREE